MPFPLRTHHCGITGHSDATVMAPRPSLRGRLDGRLEKKNTWECRETVKEPPRWTRGAKKEPSAGCFFIEFILKNVKNRGAKLTEAPAEFFSI